MFTDFDYLKKQIPYLSHIKNNEKISINVKRMFFESNREKAIIITSNLGELGRIELEKFITCVLIQKSHGEIRESDLEFMHSDLREKPFDGLELLFK
ncbi:hypothetical protein R4Y45_06195 [Holzapfeliella sp. He02]|uniref:IstB-like ATP-binding protein domain-containing protein n=1 Tax=Holzapfeliella saturejae TaxID=3082953 RepID=A0ABU8SHD3_9LACO